MRAHYYQVPVPEMWAPDLLGVQVMNIGIIGWGTFGGIIGKALKKDGHTITMFDCRKKLAASKASGWLMKPSWFERLGSKIADPSLELLDKLYGLQKVKFRIGPLKTWAYRIDGTKVLHADLQCFERKVHDVDQLTKDYEFDTVIVTAGCWSGRFANIPNLTGKQGVSFRWKGQVERNRIKPWAPYKQVVVFNEDGETVWGGDGSAILPTNWKEERVSQCLERVSKLSKLPAEKAEAFEGIRPYVPGAKPCYLEKAGKRVWVVTGGAKNGTIAAAWAALQLKEKLG